MSQAYGPGIEREEDLGGLVGMYTREIAAAKKEVENFDLKGVNCVRRYIDKREGQFSSAQWMNLFWSNVNILKAALYAKQPKTDVSRRNKDPNDDVGRVAGEMVERILNIDMDSQTSDIDIALRQCIEDRLVPGMGQVWLRYDPTFVKVSNPEYTAPEVASGVGVAAPPATPVAGEAGNDGGIPEEIEVIGDERVATDYVYWRDFLWSPARTWQDVRWVARAIYMTREELVNKFGKDIGEAVPLNVNPRMNVDLTPNDPWQKARVWEIWNKTRRKVCWFVEGFDKTLAEEDDPLQLDGFFPCPMPLVANITTSQFLPKSDYEMLRDQYVELDIITSRLALLEEAVKVVGAYDKTNLNLASMLNGSTNTMIPVDNWAMFAERGGVKGAVDWFPLEQVTNAIISMREAKAGIMHDLYELTGLSDIMRGNTVASETATAQTLKAQFGSVRLQYLQGDLARFVQQVLQIKAEIICAHFQPETIKRMSMIEFSMGDDAQLADPAIERLKDKRLAHYSLQVDPDSMALADYAAEQEQRSACITAMGSFIQNAMPLLQIKPEAAPFLLQVLQWLLASYKAGKQIEGVLDQAVRAMTATPPQPDPMQKAMQQAQLGKVQSEGEKNKSAAVLNFEKAKTAQMDAQASLLDALKPPEPVDLGGEQR